MIFLKIFFFTQKEPQPLCYIVSSFKSVRNTHASQALLTFVETLV